MDVGRENAGEHEQADRATRTLAALRDLWHTRGQSGADIAEATGSTGSCKRMRDIGFGALAGEPEDRDRDAGPAPVRGELRSAWRSQLAREGKLRPGARGLHDLVDDSDQSGEPRP